MIPGPFVLPRQPDASRHTKALAGSLAPTLLGVRAQPRRRHNFAHGLKEPRSSSNGCPVRNPMVISRDGSAPTPVNVRGDYFPTLTFRTIRRLP